MRTPSEALKWIAEHSPSLSGWEDEHVMTVRVPVWVLRAIREQSKVMIVPMLRYRIVVDADKAFSDLHVLYDAVEFLRKRGTTVARIEHVCFQCEGPVGNDNEDVCEKCKDGDRRVPERG